MLAISSTVLAELVAHAYACYPEEACGLLIGTAATAEVARFIPCENTTHSAKVYSIAPKALLRAERDAEADGLEVIGVVHSHTHTEPYPSPTDVAQAPDPGWHYAIVSLKRHAAETRNYRIVDGQIREEPLVIA